MDDEDRLTQAREAYFQAFGNEGPYPFGVSANELAAVLVAAAKSGKPVPRDFDWYPKLPKDAVV